MTELKTSNFDDSTSLEYSNLLEKMFSSIVKNYNRLQLEDHSNQTITSGTTMLKKGMQILHTIKSHAKALEALLSDCDEFIKEVTDDLAVTPKKEEFVFHTAGGMLSYPGRETLSDLLRKKLNLQSDKDIQAKNVRVSDKTKAGTDVNIGDNESKAANLNSSNTSTLTISNIIPTTLERNSIPELGYSLKMPVVTDLKNIPLALYFYKGDKTNPPGVYMNILNGNIVRMPFPEIIDSKREYDRTHSIRCKYNKKDDCDAQRIKMSKLYSSPVRVCNFAHAGDKIVKIGYPSRCPSVHDFGNPSTMQSDIKKVTLTDIQNTMLYGLNDLISAVVWLDYNVITGQTMSTLDRA